MHCGWGAEESIGVTPCLHRQPYNRSQGHREDENRFDIEQVLKLVGWNQEKGELYKPVN